ncbi:MAG: alkaline phosphatase family protein [Gemmatimonadaceae bacterium]
MAVIVLIADGARVDTLAGALDSGVFPALARLRADGGLHELTSVFPTVTGPAYTPFLMGRFPGSVGLPGLRWFDRSRETCSFPDYSRSYVGYQMRAVNRDIDPAASTIFELVPNSTAALSVITRGLPRRRQLASLTAGSALRAARTHFRGDLPGWLKVDRDVSVQVVQGVREDCSPYVFAAFTGVDKMSHARGHQSQGVLEALRIVDDTVGALREELERRGAWDETRMWVTSDHGHSRVRHHEDLARVIAGFGHRVISHPWVYRLGAEVAVMVSGNAMSHVYVDLERRERPFWRGMSEWGRELAEQLLLRDSVDVLLAPLSDTECAVWSRSRGRGTVRLEGSRYSYLTADGDPLGIGRDLYGATALEAHDAARGTDYPDSVVQIAKLAASHRAGDMILSASRDWDFRARYEPIPHVSSHGALHREHMLVPLLASHRPAHTPRRTTDIMPSALAALGIEIPAGLDGESFV